MEEVKISATPKFVQLAQKAMSTEALQELIDNLAISPEIGVTIAGTGGIRKLRWRTGKDNKGKSGGVRVLYYYDDEVLVLLITLFKKSDKENIDAGEKTELQKLLPALLEGYSHERIR